MQNDCKEVDKNKSPTGLLSGAGNLIASFNQNNLRITLTMTVASFDVLLEQIAKSDAYVLSAASFLSILAFENFLFLPIMSFALVSLYSASSKLNIFRGSKTSGMRSSTSSNSLLSRNFPNSIESSLFMARVYKVNYLFQQYIERCDCHSECDPKVVLIEAGNEIACPTVRRHG